MGDRGLTMVLCLIHFFVGGLVSSPAMSPSQATVWDLLHFPPVYLLPDMMWLRLFSDMLNSVQASLAVPSFMYLHLNCNHRAATSSLVGLFLGSCALYWLSQSGATTSFLISARPCLLWRLAWGLAPGLKYLSRTC